MSAIEDLLASYTRHVNRPWDASLAGKQKVWFIVYDPAQERRLRLRIAEFEAATLGADPPRPWRHLDLTESFAGWLSAHRHRERYFKDPGLAVYALETFKEELAQHIRETLTAPGVDERSVVAMSGVASLFGLMRVSELIGAVADDVRGRLAVFFPGSYEEKSYYRFLDARDGWDYLAVPITAAKT